MDSICVKLLSTKSKERFKIRKIVCFVLCCCCDAENNVMIHFRVQICLEG